MRELRIKYLVGVILSLMISISAFAQNSAGVEYFKLGEMKLAKNVLTNETSQNPAQAYYYLGEIAFKSGNMAEAKANYEKSVAADPDGALGQIGMAKLELKSNTKEADKTLAVIAKKNKKDINIILEIAQAYLDNGMEKEALEKAQDAKKIDKKSAWGYVFEGDILVKQKKAGEAAAQYDQAINFDPNCAIAYIKNAQVYSGINSQTAISMLKKAIEIRPDYAITNKYLGDLYYISGFYPQAIEAYTKYFANGDYSIEDIVRYAAAEYFTKNYTDAEKLISEGINRDPNNFVLHRLLMYTQNEEEKYEDGLATAEKFFSIERKDVDTSTYIVQDYTTYANILQKVGKIDEAIPQYTKAIELDKTKITLYKDLAKALADEDKPGDAAKIFDEYIKLAGDAVEANDFFQLGRYCYMAARALSESSDEEDIAKKKEYISKGDTAFATVAERIEDSYLGNFWRARIQTIADPESTEGLAKPYYEAAIAIIKSKENQNNARELVEAYTYLSYYYYLQWDAAIKAKKTNEALEAKAKMKENTDNLLEIDPENGTGQQFLKVLNQ